MRFLVVRGGAPVHDGLGVHLGSIQSLDNIGIKRAIYKAACYMGVKPCMAEAMYCVALSILFDILKRV